MTEILTISKTTQRRFILHKQGLSPAQSWKGKKGVIEAVRSGAVIQVDPLSVVARSHDIALYGRVADYQPTLLDAALYQDRALFDYGGTVMIHPMEELPYFRPIMARKANEPRWRKLADEFPHTMREVYEAVKERGPLSGRDFGGEKRQEQSYRSAKVSGQALYLLWLSGELMTHSRKGLERLYDLRERIAPPEFQHTATPDEADHFFMRKVFDEINIVTERSWRNWYVGLIERKVEKAEGLERLSSMVESGVVTQITLEDDPKTPRYVLNDDLPLLESFQAGKKLKIKNEMVFLAPLEIVSTRGRALHLFDFEYLWEVYKPAEKRRWGYYTLPILYGDRLVARMDSKFERSRGTLVVKGFWLEDHANIDAQFIEALAAGFRRFMKFLGASDVEMPALESMPLYEELVGQLEAR